MEMAFFSTIEKWRKATRLIHHRLQRRRGRRRKSPTLTTKASIGAEKARIGGEWQLLSQEKYTLASEISALAAEKRALADERCMAAAATTTATVEQAQYYSYEDLENIVAKVSAAALSKAEYEEFLAVPTLHDISDQAIVAAPPAESCNVMSPSEAVVEVEETETALVVLHLHRHR
eukprot:scaffold10460_cov136-Skeletonema_marinoi.AAC.2